MSGKYQRHVPPVVKTKNKVKAEVLVGVEMHSIVDIDEVDSLIGIEYKLMLIWFDPRLTFRNLRDRSHLNQISRRTVEAIWYPRVVFFSTQSKGVSEVIANT